MIVFPEAIPAPSQEFSFGKEPGSLRTSMESGNIRQRRTHLFNRFKASIKWELTPEEFDLFNQFLELEAAGGTAWFIAPLYTNNSIVNHKIRLINGTYQASYKSWGGWVVTSEADLEEIQTNGEGYYWIAKQDENLIPIYIDFMETIVNIDLPKIQFLQGT